MQRFLVTIVALIALVAGVVIYNNLPKPQPQALVYEPARTLQPFILESSLGREVSNTDLEGQWTLLFTGYTFCPDICPTTMADLRQVLPKLKQYTDTPVRVWMISVDPQRDNVKRVSDYAGFFGAEFVGIRAEHPQLYPFVNDLGLMYSIPEEGETDYLVNHSAAIVLVNPAGHRQAIFKAEHVIGEIPTVSMEQLATDFSIIAPTFH
ncbi:SCO family protein [Pseudidiomarina woesei]|uniref:Cytochrome oxidase Cu insertion factor, SCO1/SenC/PrrC family n=1 Tax=Pseudidiomarina woesei TaxID=1381080 RepID=A0A0K6HBU7_9GAMM|nr:SCO family protein [Pseudidiomarina woesei]CUA88231.1 Cytochrome oxidase Cu insertion factor, SCO1/SenC/PrrC family [Pseudidiomarina woesei]